MKEKRNAKICVVSENQDVANFFALEALACDCSVMVQRKPPEETVSFDLIILDSRAGYCFSEEKNCRVITVLFGEQRNLLKKAEGERVLWHWPVSVQEVREAYQSVLYRDHTEINEKRSPAETGETIFLFSDASYRILYRNQVIHLTENEWRILIRLGEEKGNPIDRKSFSSIVDIEGGNALDVHICHLRKKLEDPFGKKLIFTVRNRGYLLKASLNEMAELV